MVVFDSPCLWRSILTKGYMVSVSSWGITLHLVSWVHDFIGWAGIISCDSRPWSSKVTPCRGLEFLAALFLGEVRELNSFVMGWFFEQSGVVLKLWLVMMGTCTVSSMWLWSGWIALFRGRFVRDWSSSRGITGVATITKDSRESVRNFSRSMSCALAS
jgi:hypothetical protein